MNGRSSSRIGPASATARNAALRLVARSMFAFAASGLILLAFALPVIEGVSAEAESAKRLTASLNVCEFVPQDAKFPAERVVGPLQCRECHRAEYEQWAETKHAGRAFDLIRTESTARIYAERLGIAPQDIGYDSLCVSCHATPRVDEFGRPDVVQGISCESCHNPAGGEDGWLNLHAVYGPAGTTRETETAEHWAQRLQGNASAGKNSPYDLYSLARRCLECHAVGNEALVNAGHSSGTRRFEFAEAFLNGQRHNFHLDPNTNAPVSTLWLNQIHAQTERTVEGRQRMMLVLGAVADLEISLRNLASATDPDGDYYDEAVRRVLDAYEYLAEDLLEELSDVPGPLQQVADAAAPLYAMLDDDDFSLAKDRAACLQAADVIAQAGSTFAQTSNGDELSELDLPQTTAGQ